jgi:preprotein translocase subunit SecD
VVFSIPSLVQSEEGKKITLGLDLQGGLHMLLSVKSEVAVESKLKSVGTTIKYKLEDEDIIFDNLKIEDGTVKFELLDKDDLPKVQEVLKEDFGDIVVKQDGLKFTLTLSQKLIEETKQNAINQAVDTIRNRLNMFGLAEPTVAKQGLEKILVEVPGIKTQADEQRIR